MKIIPLGAGGEVGRSAFLFKSKEGNVLIDYGIKLHGLEKPQYPENPFNYVKNIDLFLISHGHLDHVGYLPNLYKLGKKIPWYATPPTYDIADILWRDSIKLAKLKGITEHYTNKAVEKAKSNWHPSLFGTYIRHGMFKFRFFDAGHILGSASISIELDGKRIVYSGDIGYRSFLQSPFENFGECDVLIIEGTYANKEHPDINESKAMLIEKIRETIERGGQALLPAFAVGRTQEVIMAIYNDFPDVPIYIDGMGKDITRIYLKYPTYIKHFDEFSQYCDNINFVESARDRKKALNGESIIITTAGMMDGGPVLNYVKELNDNSSIILTGFQVEGSNGHRLLTQSKLKIDGKEVNIKLPVHYIDLSAHVGKSQIIDAINMANAEYVLFCHSEKGRANEIINELQEKGIKSGELINNNIFEI
ncbi:MAG: MBL fold metallo-hydrolase [Candidatus Anstonellales archaeon]